MPAIKSTPPKPKAFCAKIPDRKNAAAFARALAGWYAQSARKLPWRQIPSLYSTVVSEFMLQQTQISTVLPYFEKWLRRFPDFEALAKAPEAALLKHWEGLGYYSRARNLHALAKEICASGIPENSRQWLRMKGVGPYTAAAISSIAQGEKIALVDGNVVRVLTRLSADKTPYPSASAAIAPLQPFAQSLMDAAQNPGAHNQAMMELGALICTRNRPPECLLCPVRIFCAVAGRADAQDFPFLAAKKTERVEKDRLWIKHGKKLLLRRAHAQAKRLAQLWELPLKEDLPQAICQKEPLMVKKRGISNQQITERIFGARLAPKNFPKGEQWIWADEKKLHALTLSGPHRRWVNLLKDFR